MLPGSRTNSIKMNDPLALPMKLHQAAEPFAFTEALPVQREANISSSLSTAATPRWGQTTLTEGRAAVSRQLANRLTQL